MSIASNLADINDTIPNNVTLVAVSKTKPNSDIIEAYNAGQRVFGENKVQELTAKADDLPKDIEWHLIGHVQTNKVKYIAPFVSLIHAVDSFKLLEEINKRAEQNNRIINCLFQVKIAEEDTKFGMSENEINELLCSNELKELNNVKIVGLMGMATNTDDENQIRNEFSSLKKIYDIFRIQNTEFKILSMGMSGDYQIAIEEGSNMVRVGSAIFGSRNYTL